MIGKGRSRLLAVAAVWLALGGTAYGGGTGGITGFVTEAGSGVPIPGALVVFLDINGQPTGVVTAGDGSFASGLTLAPGPWRVRTDAPQHLDELFDEVPCEGGCDIGSGAPVMVTAGGNAVVDFSLQPGAAIAGSVTGPGNMPVAGAQVLVRRSVTGEVVGVAVTDGAGAYQTSRSLAAGDYHVTVTNPFALIDELYPDQPCPGGNCALPENGAVAVGAGAVAAGIDFVLAAGARLSGRVTRASDATPVTTLVFVGRADQSSSLAQMSAPTGEWESPALPPGDWRVFAVGGGGLVGRAWSGASCDADCDFADSAPIAVAASSIAGLDIALDAGAVFGGTVVAADGGAPVAGALVTAYDTARQRVVSFAQTAPDGSYLMDAVLPGTLTLTARAPDFLMAAHGESCEPACTESSGAPITVAAGNHPGYDFVLQTGGSLSGTVSGPDGPLANVLVVVLDAAGTTAGVVATDGAGHYDTGSSLGSGDYRIRTANQAGLIDEAWPDAPCAAAACASDTGDLIAVTAGQATVADFTLAPGARITGQVRRAADASAVPLAAMSLSGPDDLAFGFSGQADGSYDTGTGLPPGDYRLVARDPDGVLLSEAWPEQSCSNCPADLGTPIAVAGTGVVAGIDFTLDEGATISGRVLDADTGQPVAGVDVLVFDPQTLDLLASGATGADGRYTTRSFLPAAVVALAQASGYLEAIPGNASCEGACSPEEGPLLDAMAGDLPDVDFTLRRGSRLSGQVLAPGGAPIADAMVVAMADDYAIEAQADGTGAFAFEALPNGRYVVFARGTGPYVATAWPSLQCVTGCSPDTRPVQAVDDDDVVVGIDITMLEGGTVHGRVEGMPGNIVQPGTVEFYERVSGEPAGTAVLAGGEYTSDPLPPGEYFVYTGTTGGYIDELYDDVPCPFTCDESLGTPVTVSVGNQATADFELTLGGRIAGRIFNAGTAAALPQRPTVQVRGADNAILWSATTLSNGTYTTTALPPGTYYVRSRNRSGFLDEFFLDEGCFWCVPVGGVRPDGSPANPTPVSVTLGALTTNIDLGLQPARRLGGRVTVAPGSDGAELTLVRVHDANGTLIVSVTVASDGTWLSLGGFAPGTYYLRTINPGLYFDELYGGAPCAGTCDVTQGTPVVLTAGADRTDLDFSLAVQPQVFADGFE